MDTNRKNLQFTSKTCTGCGVVKLIEDYFPSGQRKNRNQPCKICTLANTRKRYHDPDTGLRERQLERGRERYKKIRQDRIDYQEEVIVLRSSNGEGISYSRKDTKTCKFCNTTKPLTEFYKSPDGYYQRACYICWRKHSNKRARERWANLPEVRKRLCSGSATRSKAKRIANKDRAIEYLGGKCANCGGVFHRNAFDFHHINPAQKERHIQPFLYGPWENLEKELDKCELLCANCHRIEHSALQENSL